MNTQKDNRSGDMNEGSTSSLTMHPVDSVHQTQHTEG